jgi:hypothetical protein
VADSKFDSIELIKEAVADKESDMEALRTRFNDDFNLLTLEDWEPDKRGYEAYTSSAPRNFFDKVTDGLNRADLTISIELPEDAKDDLKREASNGELFLYGALNEIDRVHVARGEPRLRELLAWYIGCRGWWGLRTLVYVPKDESSVRFDVQAWDPLHMTWEQGTEGQAWAAYKTVISKAIVEAEYPDYDIGDKKEVIRIDFFDDCNNAVIIGDEWAKPPEEHEIGHTPVNIGSVGSMPTLQPSITSLAGNSANQLTSLLEHRGDSVFTASRGLYDFHNKYVANLMDVQKRAVVGSLVHTTETGASDIEGDPYESWRIIPMKSPNTLKPLELPVAPPETSAILGLIQADIQQSTLPYPLAYGGTTEELSGRALDRLNESTGSVYSPRTGAETQAYRWLCEELLLQFNKKIDKPTTLRGFKDQKFFEVKAIPGDINPEWYVSVVIEPRMPRDKFEEIQMALAATSIKGPDALPLVSQDTAREEYIKLPNPKVEEDKVLAEKGKSLPPILMTNIAVALKRAGEDELASQITALLQDNSPPTNGVAPQGVPTPNGAQPPVQDQPGQSVFDTMPPELAEVIRAVTEVLVQAGQQQLAEQFLQALTQGALTPEMLKPVVEILIQAQQQQLADALLAVLGMQVQNEDQRLQEAGLVRGRV